MNIKKKVKIEKLQIDKYISKINAFHEDRTIKQWVLGTEA